MYVALECGTALAVRTAGVPMAPCSHPPHVSSTTSSLRWPETSPYLCIAYTWPCVSHQRALETPVSRPLGDSGVPRDCPCLGPYPVFSFSTQFANVPSELGVEEPSGPFSVAGVIEWLCPRTRP